MSYTVKFEHPQFPEGYEFGINDLGMIPNGGSIEISEETERQFVAHRGRSIEDCLKNTFGATLTGSSSLSEDELKTLIREAPVATPDSGNSDSSSADSTTGSEPTLVTPPKNDGGEM